MPYLLLVGAIVAVYSGISNQKMLDIFMLRGHAGGTEGEAPIDPDDPATDVSGAPVTHRTPTTNPAGGGPTGKGEAKEGNPTLSGTSIGSLHPTAGLPGYPAHDYFAPSGSVAVAPVDGTITRFSGHDPRLGPIEGNGGPLGWSIYLKGTNGHSYFITHLGSRSVRVGMKVRAGDHIGTVADYAKYGVPSHIHMGVHQ